MEQPHKNTKKHNTNLQQPTTDEVMKTLKKTLEINPENSATSYLLHGPSYQDMNKTLANLSFTRDEELKGIYHLTEAHAASLRHQTAVTYDYKDYLLKKDKNNYNKMAHGINKMYITFDSDFAIQEEEGLLQRLSEMPSEWTVVQVTRQYDPQGSLGASTRAKDAVPKLTSIFITQLPCGPTQEDRAPVKVLVAPPETTKGMPTLFDLINEAEKKLKTKSGGVREIFKCRKQASENIEAVVTELASRVLKQWRTLLLGKLCSKAREEEVATEINNVLARHPPLRNKHIRQLLDSVASGAAYLNDSEIESAVTCLVDCPHLANDLISAIQAIKKHFPVLLIANRHPVILILDEELECLPWEMIDVLKRHPVSRVPSIHFLHALYHLHKDHIVDGCRLVDKADTGFYIINPDEDLKLSESRLMTFLKERIPSWRGVKGEAPTKEQFSGALAEKSLFLYCGHFNGTHLYHQEEISKLRVVALPLLFGCSSVAQQPVGGRTRPSGASDMYLMAGCACVVGMLWSVMSDDVDCMTVTLLNSWLPGEPIDLKDFRPEYNLLPVSKNPELLRLLRCVRDTAKLFSNSAALVARGIPVRMVDNSLT